MIDLTPMARANTPQMLTQCYVSRAIRLIDNMRKYLEP